MTAAVVLLSAGAAKVRLTGALDVLARPEVGRALARAGELGAGATVVDLEHVTFFDSGMLGLLLAAQRRHASRGRSVVLRGVPPELRRCLEHARLDHLFVVDERVPRLRRVA